MGRHVLDQRKCLDQIMLFACPQIPAEGPAVEPGGIGVAHSAVQRREAAGNADAQGAGLAGPLGDLQAQPVELVRHEAAARQQSLELLGVLLGLLAVLSGLAAVDWVVPFAEDTPERLICSILPDVLVKGGDYRPEQIAGGRCVLENGGEVRVLSFREGCSTSSILERVRSGPDGKP